MRESVRHECASEVGIAGELSDCKMVKRLQKRGYASMSEKDLRDFIEKETKDIIVPEKLQPEMMEKRLMEYQKKLKKQRQKKIAAAAACCAAAVGIGAVAMNVSNQLKYSQLVSDFVKYEEKESGAVETIATASDYDEIYDWINTKLEQEQKAQSKAYAVMEYAVEDSASTGSTMAVTTGSSYSDTNVREEGVGEADIIKTDGDYIYILNGDKISIVGIALEELEDLGEIQLESDSYYAEMYVKDDRLIAFYTKNIYEDRNDGLGEYYHQETIAEIFDVANPSAPKKVTTISQSGNYHSVRIVGDYVYLFSDFYADISFGRSGVAAYIPEVQGEKITSDSIYMPQSTDSMNYTVISGFSLKNPEEQIDRKAVFGTGSLFYASKDYIYVCEILWDANNSDTAQTCIRKLSYKDGVIKPVGQTRIDGRLNDSFSIDEYEDNLRLVATVEPDHSDGVMPLVGNIESAVSSKDEETSYNVLYILDENLNELSRIENLAPDEMVYSARFMGDTGYFVTYKQIDPLFSVDLSDPKNPKILGELKIPGFSEYLHPYGEGLLLGIGMDVDETGTVTNGVKVSMFDISDPANVQEADQYVIEGAFSTDVSYNYKTALVDAEKNIIGFIAYSDGGADYYVFSYGDEGFTCEFEKSMVGYSSSVRGIYSGDKFYIVTGNTVESFMLESFDKVDDLVL